MYKPAIITLIIFFCISLTLAQFTKPEKFKIKDFYLGMERSEVKVQYELFQKKKVAKYISIEKENYRDLIMLDNEFSSMGNKLEIAYDESLKCNGITFQYKTVDILFDAAKMEAKDFVEKFKKDYKIPKMEYKNMGFVNSWIYTDEKQGIKISIDDYKNLRLQYLTK